MLKVLKLSKYNTDVLLLLSLNYILKTMKNFTKVDSNAPVKYGERSERCEVKFQNTASQHVVSYLRAEEVCDVTPHITALRTVELLCYTLS